MKIEYEGQVYDYDDENLTVAQGMAIERHIEGTLLDWQQGLMNARTACYQALAWVIFRGGDPAVKIADVEFPVIRLAKAFMTALTAEAAALTAETEAAVAEAEAQVAPNGEDPTLRPAPPLSERA